MKIVCDACQKTYNVPDEHIPPEGVEIPCKQCSRPLHLGGPQGNRGAVQASASGIGHPFAPVADAPPPVARAETGMTCFVHSGVGAVAICSRCGNPVCPSCQSKMFGKNFCDVCAKLEMSAQVAPQAPPPPQQIVIQQVMSGAPAHPVWSPGVATLLSFFVPGLGQMYKGQLISGMAWFLSVGFGYMMLVLPGLILHFICIITAHSGDPMRHGG